MGLRRLRQERDPFVLRLGLSAQVYNARKAREAVSMLFLFSTGFVIFLFVFAVALKLLSFVFKPLGWLLGLLFKAFLVVALVCLAVGYFLAH